MSSGYCCAGQPLPCAVGAPTASVAMSLSAVSQLPAARTTIAVPGTATIMP
jgi:hypothetical protein